MVFYTYPVELVQALKQKGAEPEVEPISDGTFKLKLRSHFIIAKNLMKT